MMNRRHHRWLVLGGLLCLLVLVLAACNGDEDPLAEDPTDPEDDGEEVEGDPDAVTVGSANFPESVLLANIYAMALEDIGVDVETQTNIGAREVYFPALEQGDVDLLPEYVGSLLNFLADEDVTETDLDTLLEELRDEVGDDVEVLEPSEAENANALVVTQETAEEYDLEVTSDLEGVSEEFVIGGAPEAQERADGLPGYERVYGIEFGEFRALDPGGPLTIAALEDGEIDIARLFTSQGVIADRDWVVLDDDGDLIPPENIVPVIRSDALTDEIEERLGEVSEALTLDELTALNQRTEVDNEDPPLVAEDWLTEQGLIGS
jgi:osmoprotectant transport system substrate-binding protein